MRINLISTKKIIRFFLSALRVKLVLLTKLALLALFCLFVTCKDSGGAADEYDDSIIDLGEVKELTFSHDSGLYEKQFNLTIAAAEGSEIYYSTDGSIPSPEKTGNGYVFKYDSPIRVKNRNREKNVLSSPKNSTNMYGYENDPRGYMPVIYKPNDNQVPKATVIRAIAADSSGGKSDVITKTYFIGNNLADYADNRVLSIVSDPYNLVDEDFGIMVRGNPKNRWDSKPPYNFCRKGID